MAIDEEINLVEHRHIETLQSIEVVSVVTSNHDVDYREDIIVANTQNNNITLRLPPARGGRKFCIVKGHAENTLTIVFSGSESMLGITSIEVTSLAERRWFKSVSEGYIPL